MFLMINEESLSLDDAIETDDPSLNVLDHGSLQFTENKARHACQHRKAC